MKRYYQRVWVAWLAMSVVSCSVVHGDELRSAIKTGDVMRVKTILQAKPELVNDRVQSRVFSIPPGDTSLHITPLGIAVLCNQTEVAEALIALGANVNDAECGNGVLLHNAVVSRHPRIVELLVKHGADVNIRDANGKTALFWAVIGGDKETIKILRSHSAIGADGIDAVAASGNDEAVVALLKGHPELANERDKMGRTPLHWAVFYGKTSTVETLLAHGADINSKDVEGKSTPLRMAAVIGYVDIVKLLLRHQPDLNATDWDGKTALQRAKDGCDTAWWKARVPNSIIPDTKKWLEIVELLRASGAQ